MFLKACLNGGRAPDAHPRLPRSPDELAAAAVGAVKAGADALHVHPRDAEGAESLGAGEMASALLAIRAVCPNVALGVSTGAWIEPEVSRRVALIERWKVLPDFASVNLHEHGAERVIEALLGCGVGVEAGIWTPDAARRLRVIGEVRYLRLLLEPTEENPGSATDTVQGIEAELERGDASTPRLLHGKGAATWAMFDLAAARGYAGRIGLEDTLHLPSGELAPDNAALVRAARERLAQLHT